MRCSCAALLLLAVVAGLPLLSCAADYPSIAAALKANKMTMFSEAAQKTGFISQLQSPGFLGTVFAPTDEAFQAALDTANVTKQQLFDNNTLLVDIIMYHVIPGNAISSDRLMNDGQYTSMRGKALTITKSVGGDGIAVNSGSTATVTDRDMYAGVAMFNIVDNLLLPPDELASLNLRQADKLKFMTTLEEATGYDESLTKFYSLVQESKRVQAFLGNKSTVATVFAPVDDAWYTIEQMSGYYTGNPQAVLSNRNALQNLLQYHIFDGRALRAGQLKENQTLTMMNGEKVTVHVSEKAAKKVVEDVARERTIAAKISGVPLNMHVFLTPNTDGDESTIISGNVVAGRSLLHKVDAVLIPKSMLRFLEITSDKKFGVKKTKKKGNETLTVKEALLGNGTAANATAGNKTDGRSAVTVVNGDAASKQGRNATRAASGATQLLASAAVGLPSLLLAAVMLL